ncbi:MAG: signal peptidase I [bacterium]
MKKTKIEVISNVNMRPEQNIRSNMGSRMSSFAKKFFNSSQILVVVLGVIVLIYFFVASFSIVDGPSMLPNFETGNFTIYEKVTTSWGKLERGDVIVFQAENGKDFIKRVIGIPGDVVMILGGKVYVNNVVIKEDYLSEENKYVKPGSRFLEGIPIKAADDEYIAFGDNRLVSQDSRTIGPIKKEKIKGKVWAVFWPMDKAHIVNHVRYPELSK